MCVPEPYERRDTHNIYPFLFSPTKSCSFSDAKINVTDTSPTPRHRRHKSNHSLHRPAPIPEAGLFSFPERSILPCESAYTVFCSICLLTRKSLNKKNRPLLCGRQSFCGLNGVLPAVQRVFSASNISRIILNIIRKYVGIVTRKKSRNLFPAVGWSQMSSAWSTTLLPL